ncbi:MAG: cupin domain-containing protein, partial [Spirochaetota bacterium]
VLGVRLGTFLDETDNAGPVISKAGSRGKIVRFSAKEHAGNSDLDFYSLASDKTGRHMEPFVIDLYPSSAVDAKLSSHEGEEFVYVLEGQIEVNYGKETYILSQGDSIYYDSVVSHNVHSCGSAAAKVLAVVYAP